MGRTILTSRDWIRRLAAGTALGAERRRALPTSVAAAATPPGWSADSSSNSNSSSSSNSNSSNSNSNSNSSNNSNSNSNRQQQQQAAAGSCGQGEGQEEPRPRRPRRRPRPRPRPSRRPSRAGGQGAGPGRAKRAAQLAAATQRARKSWDSHARPEKLAIVRTPHHRPGDQRKPDPAGAAPAGHHDHVRPGPLPAEQLADASQDGTAKLVGRGRALPGRGHGDRRRRRGRSGWPVGAKPSRRRLDLHRQRQAAGARRDRQLLRPDAPASRCRSARVGRSSWCPATAR